MEGDGRRMKREISDLPDGVLENIVSRLPLSDAVRAGLVAKPWRHGWKLTKEMNFDDTFYDEFIEETNYRLDSVVYSILSRHIGSIDTFDIRIMRRMPGDVSVDITEGIASLSVKKVKYLTIYVNQLPYLELPSEIYNFSDVLSLNLQRCTLSDATSFNGFPNIDFIRLCDVLVSDNMLNLMISRSPRLSDIHLEFFHDGNPVELHQAALENLDTLVYHCQECIRPLHLMIRLPNLTCASFKTRLQLPALQTSRLEYFSSLIPRVTNLTLDSLAISSLIDELPVPMALTSPLRYLDDLLLEFIDIGVDEMLARAFCLIRNAPYLTCLQVHVDQDDVDHAGALNFLIEQQRLPPLTRMKSLSFENLINTPIEMKLIKTLIQLSPRLKTVYFKPCVSIDREDEEELHRQLRKIQLPKRARLKFVYGYVR